MQECKHKRKFKATIVLRVSKIAICQTNNKLLVWKSHLLKAYTVLLKEHELAEYLSEINNIYNQDYR